MDVEIVSTSILKPTTSSLSHPNLSNSATAKIPLTIFDRAVQDFQISVLYAFRPPTPANDAIKDGLSKALDHFPHLAGRFTVDNHGQPCIHLNSAGVRLIETLVAATLAERLPLNPSDNLRPLQPPVENVEELLQIQLNRFSCGGLVIGLTSHHRVADGHSMSSFFLAWARLVRGLKVGAPPYHDRRTVSMPREPPGCEFKHREIEFRDNNNSAPATATINNISEKLVVNFSSELIGQLKDKMLDQESEVRYTTFECLLSHLWKKVTEARALGEDETTQVRIAVNGRTRTKPEVPMEYFGNLVLWAHPRLKVKDLLNKSYTFVARAIREAVAKINDRYFASFVDFGELSKGERLAATAPAMGDSFWPDLEVDSWLRFQFHELDFGGGGPCEFLPPNITVEGMIVLVPSCKEKGGVDVYTRLSPNCRVLFEQICHSLEY